MSNSWISRISSYQFNCHQNQEFSAIVNKYGTTLTISLISLRPLQFLLDFLWLKVHQSKYVITWRRLMRCSKESLMVLEKASFLKKLCSQIMSREALNSSKKGTNSLSFSSSVMMPWPVPLIYELNACLTNSSALTLWKRVYILWRSLTRFASISSTNPW